MGNRLASTKNIIAVLANLTQSEIEVLTAIACQLQAKTVKLNQLQEFVINISEATLPQASVTPPMGELPTPGYSKKKHGSATTYLERYRPWIEAGLVFQNTLRIQNPQLMRALDREFKERRDELRAILPTKQDEVTARIERAVGKPVHPSERARLADITGRLSQLHRKQQY